MADESGSNKVKTRRSFTAFRLAAWSTSGLVALIALAALVGSSWIPQGAVQRAVQSVAAVVFAIGLVHILSDAYLHARLSEEILERVDGIRDDILEVVQAEIGGVLKAIQLKADLERAGVQNVARSAIDWQAFFGDARKIVLLPADLRTWLNEEWQAVLELGRRAPLEVELLIPSADSPEIGDLGHRFDQEPDELAKELSALATTVDSHWTTRSIVAENLLVVKTYDRPCGFGLAIADDRWALSVPGILGPRAGNRSVVALFRQGLDPGFADWAEAQIQSSGARLFNQRKAP